MKLKKLAGVIILVAGSAFADGEEVWQSRPPMQDSSRANGLRAFRWGRRSYSRSKTGFRTV